MGDFPSRQEVAKELGRRVSRGEYERLLNLQFSHKSKVQSSSRGRATGAARVTTVLHPLAPKAKRKHAKTDELAARTPERPGIPTRRARYVFV